MVGPLHPKLYKSAQAFEDELETDYDQPIPYVVNDGTMAALINLVSEDQVCRCVLNMHSSSDTLL